MNPASPNTPASQGQKVLDELLQLGIVNARDLDALPNLARTTLARQENPGRLLVQLVDCKLLTPYQAERIRTGKVHGLMLGNYRVRDRLGVGNAGVVFRGEHRETGAQVAIKVLIPARGDDSSSMLRFFAERRTVAQLSHPGIVHALDVGETTSDDPAEPVLYYYVMEYVAGADLEQHVRKHGPMEPAVACAVAYQVADALTEAHRHNLVHRDIKPANIMLTAEGRALLLDFGLVRQFDSRQTEPGTLIGIMEWVSPEQIRDSREVDIRADIYSLGCTLYWCLTGKSAFGGKVRAINELFNTPPPSVRTACPELSPLLDALVTRMMAPRPEDRPDTPQAVMELLKALDSENNTDAAPAEAAPVSTPESLAPTSAARVLVVDPDRARRELVRSALAQDGLTCAECSDGNQALEAAASTLPDLVLLAADLPGRSGLEVLKSLRQDPRWLRQKIIMLTGAGADVRPLLAAGADDYLVNPLTADQLRARVKTALRTKQAPAPSAAPPAPDVNPEAPAPEPPPTLWQRARGWLGGKKKSDGS